MFFHCFGLKNKKKSTATEYELKENFIAKPKRLSNSKRYSVKQATESRAEVTELLTNPETLIKEKQRICEILKSKDYNDLPIAILKNPETLEVIKKYYKLKDISEISMGNPQFFLKLLDSINSNQDLETYHWYRIFQEPSLPSTNKLQNTNRSPEFDHFCNLLVLQPSILVKLKDKHPNLLVEFLQDKIYGAEYRSKIFNTDPDLEKWWQQQVGSSTTATEKTPLLKK